MPGETIEQGLQRKLDEAECLSEEDREVLTALLAKFREASAAMERNPAIGPEEAAKRREKMRVQWLEVLETCRKVAVLEGELLGKRADLADSMRAMTMSMLRNIHAVRKTIEEGNFTGTWEQRESMMEMVGEVEDAKASLIEDLTVEDIRQLKDEGVL